MRMYISRSLIGALLSLAIGLAQNPTPAPISPPLQTRPAVLGSLESYVAYPAGAGVPYAPASQLAKALGLGYLGGGSRLSLSIGSRVASFTVYPSEAQAVSGGGAWQRSGGIWVPLPLLARTLDLFYEVRGREIAVGLKPARLLGAVVTQSEGVERITLQLDRDVSARLLSDDRVGLVGVTGGEAEGVTINSVAYGLEVGLPGSGPARLYFLPRQVVVERGNPKGSRIPLVVIDPGHGGADPGTIQSGIREKDLTLNLAQTLRTLLAPSGIRVSLTRQGDQALSLQDRANAGAFAQVLLSVHVTPGDRVNLYTNPNQGKLLFISKGRQLLPNTPEPRKSLLLGYVSPEGSSTDFAKLLSEEISAVGVVSALGEGDYLALSQNGGAAVLVEFGFDNVSTPQGRQQLAQAMANAILKYLGRFQPTNSAPGTNPPPSSQPKPGGNP
ncbi:cell wall hydrolase/autolysin [Allomeiothermus silvanus DSM 9946]|uniref:Cell wall hydrolase/autolysin n=1 Tax=Allomeiothermus silvanus (strain ATCC 700542 / DSM 9946 / NBRC 106475 / NCIMB 13440 / VI-R2) TaxID=526227 RepID=D7BH68_ALLS1|nr:N-acetylmuramoyl-L-alanine amidase [Allomeiothermus silvanus]ADH63921.1 cell wall hydrolase/autolysin [Allomeiothermus silvanus DSM 9946]